MFGGTNRHRYRCQSYEIGTSDEVLINELFVWIQEILAHYAPKVWGPIQPIRV